MLNDNERKRIILFVLTLTISSLGTSIVVSVFPYFILALKIPMKEYGLIGTIASTIIIFSRIPFSSIMPVVGYFKTFYIGYSFIMFSRLFYYFASLGIFSFIFFSIGVIFSRMMFPVYNTVRGTVIAKYFSSERRASVMGIISALQTLFSSIGPFIGSYMYQGLGMGFSAIFITSFLILLIGIIPLLYLSLNDETTSKKETSILDQFKMIPLIFKHRKLLYTLIVFQIDGFSWSLIFMYTSIYIAQTLKATPNDQAVIYLVSNIIGILGFIFSGYLSDKMKKRVFFLILSELTGIIFLSLYVLAWNIFIIYISAIFMGFMFSFWGPISTAYITEKSEEISKDIIPITMGVWGFLGSIARTPGPLIGGYLYDYSPRAPFITTIMLLIFVIILLIMIKD